MDGTMASEEGDRGAPTTAAGRREVLPAWPMLLPRSVLLLLCLPEPRQALRAAPWLILPLAGLMAWGGLYRRRRGRLVLDAAGLTWHDGTRRVRTTWDEVRAIRWDPRTERAIVQRGAGPAVRLRLDTFDPAPRDAIRHHLRAHATVEEAVRGPNGEPSLEGHPVTDLPHPWLGLGPGAIVGGAIVLFGGLGVAAVAFAAGRVVPVVLGVAAAIVLLARLLFVALEARPDGLCLRSWPWGATSHVPWADIQDLRGGGGLPLRVLRHRGGATSCRIGLSPQDYADLVATWHARPDLEVFS